MGYVIKMVGAFILFGVILLIIDGKYIDAITIAIVYSVLAGIASWLGKKWTKRTEKKAYATYQKHYGIVVVSDEWLKTSELGDGDLDIEDIFPKEHTSFYDTNKVGTSSAFTLKEWNTQKGVVHLSHDPTFIVTTDHHSVRSHETNQRPFLVTSDAAEAVRFLESHK